MPKDSPATGAAIESTRNRELANCTRTLSIDMVEAANSGHPGAPLGMADAAAILYTRTLSSTTPHLTERTGTGSCCRTAMLYSLLYLSGYESMTLGELRNFRQWGAKTAGHPECGHAPGIETTTGPLGQGLASAVGMAMAERLMAERFGADLVDHRTYVFAGDGYLEEGIGQEAISLAGHFGLSKLVVLYDDNSITIDGSTSVSFSEDVPSRFKAYGWRVLSCDGHDAEALDAALTEARNGDEAPTLISMKTVIGFGAPTKAGTAGSHGAPLGAKEAATTKEALGCAPGDFNIPAELLSLWRNTSMRGAADRAEWQARLESRDAAEQAEFTRRISGVGTAQKL